MFLFNNMLLIFMHEFQNTAKFEFLKVNERKNFIFKNFIQKVFERFLIKSTSISKKTLKRIISLKEYLEIDLVILYYKVSGSFNRRKKNGKK